MDDNARVQLVLGILIFGGTVLGLLLLALLRFLDWQRNRRSHRTSFLQENHQTREDRQPVYLQSSIVDPYAIAEEALKLVDQVQAENNRLRQQLARYAARNPQGGAMPARQWLAIVNDEPNLVPHLGIEGATRTGKTTLATGILHDRPGQILIITAKTGDDWGGLPYVTVDDDGSFRTAAATFKALHREVLRRLVMAKHDQDPGLWLTIVLDDYPALRDACPEADEPFLLVARVGASLRVRLIVLTYSLNVKELGLEGKGDARHHFTWIKRTRHGTERTATMQWEGVTYDLETGPVIAQASRPLDPTRAWTPILAPEDISQIAPPAKVKRGLLSRVLPHRRHATTGATPDADALLERLLSGQDKGPATSVSAQDNQQSGHNGGVPREKSDSGIAGIPHQEASTTEDTSDTTSRDDTGSDTAPQVRDLPNEVIRALFNGERWSANRIAQYLYGSKQKRLQRIEQATASEKESETTHTT